MYRNGQKCLIDTCDITFSNKFEKVSIRVPFLTVRIVFYVLSIAPSTFLKSSWIYLLFSSCLSTVIAAHWANDKLYDSPESLFILFIYLGLATYTFNWRTNTSKELTNREVETVKQLELF